MSGDRWGFEGWGFEGWGAQPRKGGAPKGGGPKGGEPKFCGPEAAGVSHDNPRAQTCTFEGPGLQKHHQNSTRRPPEREEKNEFCGGRGKKKERNVGRSRGRAVPGAPNMTKPKPLNPQTETVKPTPTPHKHTQAHTSTHKHSQTLTNTHKHSQTLTNTHTHTHTNTHKHKSKSVWPKSVWPKSVLANVGHTTKTLTLANSRFGQTRSPKRAGQTRLAKVGLAKVGHDRKRMHWWKETVDAGNAIRNTRHCATKWTGRCSPPLHPDCNMVATGTQ